MVKTIIIHQLDTGYLIEAKDSNHAITSKDTMIAKVRELLDISRQKQNVIQNIPITIPTDKQPATPVQLTTTSVLAGTTHINKSDYIVPDAVPLPNNEKVTYFETQDGRILIQYQTGRVTTTFDEINQLLTGCKDGDESKNIPQDISANRKTCIRQFMIAVRNGLKPGDSVKLDPDKDFRPLNISSNLEYERGTLESVGA